MRKTDPNSTPGVIKALGVGQSAVPRIVRLDGNLTNKTDIAQVHEQFHRDMTPVISRLKSSDMFFTAEQFTAITKSGDFLVGLCVTRTA